MSIDPVSDPAPAALHAPDREAFRHFLSFANHEQALGRHESAIRLYRLAIEIDREDVDLVLRLSRALFCTERWAPAWRYFSEVRRRLSVTATVTRRNAAGERVELSFWGGGTPPKRLLVTSEQGLGDTIHFARFLRPLAQQGVEVALVCSELLHPLLGTLPGSVRLLSRENPQTVPGVDGWTNLFDLPVALGLDPAADYGMNEPYLSADPARVARWRKQLGSHGRMIGIQWRGNPDAPFNDARSASLADFAALAELPDVRLICLQKDATPEEIAAVPFADKIEHLGNDFDTGPGAFLDSAAVMHCLERVVSVDTAIVHLAGALGRPVDVLLQPRWADWRWLARESETIWYPSMRLWRREAEEPWDQTISRLAAHHGPTRVLPGPVLQPSAPTSVGDLIDRLTILDLKAERIHDPDKRAHAEAERVALSRVLVGLALEEDTIAPLVAELVEVNATLWDVEDALRRHEMKSDFGADFVRLARLVYQTNDRRAALKRAINLATGSGLVEVKSYAEAAEKADPAPQHRRKKSKAA